jgi:hypothetical protein
MPPAKSSRHSQDLAMAERLAFCLLFSIVISAGVSTIANKCGGSHVLLRPAIVAATSALASDSGLDLATAPEPVASSSLDSLLDFSAAYPSTVAPTRASTAVGQT